MNRRNERESERGRQPESDRSPPESAPTRRRRRSTGDLGNALRSAYDRVVEEDVPPEMLDLLGKLG